MENSTIQQRKAERRQTCGGRRGALPPADVATAGRRVLRHLLDLEAVAAAETVHTYVSSKNNEVDTRGFIQTCLDRGKRVVIPVVQPGSRTLRHAEIDGLADLKPDRWGLYNPPAERTVWWEDLSGIDVVIVPGLAFDRRGYRLGFGGGYYDRFLARLTAVKIGLIYDCLRLDEVPVEPHDAVMDLVVTETAVYDARA